MKKITYTFLILIISIGFFHKAEALTVSPAKIEVVGDPGSVLSGELEIFNEQDETKIFYTSYENFEPSGDSGAPYFVGGGSGLATWIETQSELTIGAGERTVVPYKITIPENAAPGGYFSAIFLGNQPPVSSGSSEVTIGGKIGILVLLRVSGDIEEKGGLLSFETKDQKRFFTSLPISFEYKLNNLGGDRVVPAGEVKIKNSFWLTTANLLANKNEGSVLPNSSRKFEVTWQEEQENKKKKEDVAQEEKLNFFQMAGKQAKDFHLGLYTAKLNITWGETNQTAKDSYLIFVFPWQLLSIVFIILIVVGFFGLRLVKRYNRWIIAQARGANNFSEDTSAPRKTVRRSAPLREIKHIPVKRIRKNKDE